MTSFNINNVRAKGWLCCGAAAAPLSAAALALALAACQSDWRNGIAENPDVPVAFTAVTAPALTATRADGSLVNRLETLLPTTGDYAVGIFGYYTADKTWQQATTTVTNGEGDDAVTTTTYPSANFLYNQKADIALTADGKANALTYTPLRFWPNNTFVADPAIPSQETHEYVSFWAYYPYNATETPGQYGISFLPTATSGIGETQGMGSIRFTMHPDAAEQNDFLISDLIADCNRDQYPLLPVEASAIPSQTAYSPKPVPLRFHHLLAQVRLYAFIKGRDRIAYIEGDEPECFYATGETYTDEWGVTKTVTEEQAGKVRKIDEDNTVRWQRTALTDLTGIPFADITYSMSFNNISTSCVFTPAYNPATMKTTVSYTDATTLGSATVNNYIMNPYWFRFYQGERIMLNDDYMYDDFESTAAAKGQLSTDNIDGIDWSEKGPDCLHYLVGEGDAATAWAEELEYAADPAKHHNYAPGNILMVVPQKLDDDDVPNIVITAKGKDQHGNDITARVTINMLQMDIKWESGFIYCYAFLDDLQPGDDKVRGPETITVIFDPERHTDQW